MQHTEMAIKQAMALAEARMAEAKMHREEQKLMEMVDEEALEVSQASIKSEVPIKQVSTLAEKVSTLCLNQVTAGRHQQRSQDSRPLQPSSE